MIQLQDNNDVQFCNTTNLDNELQKNYTPIVILNYIKRLDSFPNTCIAYKILLTIPVTVAFAERSFSKLKLIKS